MSDLYDPKNRRFSEALSAIDRCQIAMVRELANSTDGKLILKGGMAMRVAVGSMRLAGEVDFDRADGVSTASVQSNVKRAQQLTPEKARKLLSVCGSPGQFLQRWFGLWWKFQAPTQF